MRSCGNTSPPSCKCNFKGLGVRESHIDPAENCEICPTHETCDDDNVLFGHERKRNRREGSCTPCVIYLSLSSPLPLPSKYRPSSSGQRYFIHPLHASPQIDSLQTWAEPRTRPRGPSLGRSESLLAIRIPSFWAPLEQRMGASCVVVYQSFRISAIRVRERIVH